MSAAALPLLLGLHSRAAASAASIADQTASERDFCGPSGDPGTQQVRGGSRLRVVTIYGNVTIWEVPPGAKRLEKN